LAQPSARTNQPLLLTHIGQLLTLRSESSRPNSLRRGAAMRDLGIIEDAAVLCAGGKIVSVGAMRDAARDPWLKRHRRQVTELDCGGRVVLPGFVDSHTHPVFAAPRLVDFEKRISGATYEEIAAAGGGIASSVSAVRKARRSELAANVARALDQAGRHGTTTIECKSGYGLSTEAEIKSLEAIRDAARAWPGTVVPTLLGAHVCPPELKSLPDKYLHEIVKQMLPRAAEAKLAAFVDVFIERGAFTLEQAEQVFTAAENLGLGARAHVCQLSPGELWPLLRFHPASFDHLDCVSDEDIAQLARRDVVATLLPGANYFLGLGAYPPARKLLDAGAAVALATDYNPGTSPTLNMQFIVSLACTQMRMSPAEAITAATYNGACALKLQDRKGSLEPGKDADLTIFDLRDWREIAYWFGGNACWTAIAAGVAALPNQS